MPERPKVNEPLDRETDTRFRIIQAAKQEFADHGFAGSRVDRIASRAGVNKAMIYYYFDSKTSLHREIVTASFHPILQRLRQAFEESIRLEDALGSFVNAYYDAVLAEPDLRRILLRELAEPQSDLVRALADAIGESVMPGEIVKGLETGIAGGTLRQIDVRQALVSFMLMTAGYVVLAPIVDRVWQVADKERFVAERKRAIIDLFLYGVVKR